MFQKYPGVRQLFHTQPEEQQKKLVASITAIVASVTKPEVMLPYLRAMGIRHIAYKTEEGHYKVVAENLLAVLSKHLSKEGEWNKELQDNWTEAMQIISDVMIEPNQYQDEPKTAGFQANGFSINSVRSRELRES